MADRTLAEAIARALEAYPGLVAVAEGVADEWQYTTDLATAWQARLRAVAAARADEPSPPDADLAVESAIAEIERIEDPHRAIDWLSTFPQVVLAAFGEMG